MKNAILLTDNNIMFIFISDLWRYYKVMRSK